MAQIRTHWNRVHTRQIERELMISKVLEWRMRFHLRTVHP